MKKEQRSQAAYHVEVHDWSKTVVQRLRVLEDKATAKKGSAAPTAEQLKKAAEAKAMANAVKNVATLRAKLASAEETVKAMETGTFGH